MQYTCKRTPGRSCIRLSTGLLWDRALQFPRAADAHASVAASRRCGPGWAEVSRNLQLPQSKSWLLVCRVYQSSNAPAAAATAAPAATPVPISAACRELLSDGQDIGRHIRSQNMPVHRRAAAELQTAADVGSRAAGFGCPATLTCPTGARACTRDYPGAKYSRSVERLSSHASGATSALP